MFDGVEVQQIRDAIERSLPLSFRSAAVPEEFIAGLEGVLSAFLTELGHGDMLDPLFFCVQELVSNAKKANNKRVYFTDKKLDIHDPGHYAKGMETFREEVFSNVAYYLKRMEEEGCSVEVVFHRRGQSMVISVANNIEMTAKEQLRVFNRIARSRAFSNVEEAFSSVLDDSEGAGLGLVIVLLFLKKMGMGEDSFELVVREGTTRINLRVPFSQVHMEGLEAVAEKITAELEILPKFPENILALQHLLSDPSSELSDMARLISRDPAFTAELLRHVNSAAFLLSRKVKNVIDAVKMAGTRFLRNMLYSYGTQTVLSDKYPQMRQLWNHSYQVAFYSYVLARNVLRTRRSAEDVYVGGILHDLGKIIVDYLYPDLLDALEDFAEQKGIPRKLLEGLSFGINHASIGGRIAQEWNFPAGLVEAISYHHEPQNCDAEQRDIVYVVYLANLLSLYGEDSLRYEQIDADVLAHLRIRDEEHLRSIRQSLETAYAARQESEGP